MKLKFFALRAAIAMVLSVTLPCYAEPTVGVGSNVDFYSDYMFRGISYYAGSSIQPSLDVALDFGDNGVIGLGLWSHISAEGGEGPSNKFFEIDYIATYSVTFEPVTLTTGHIWYTFPDDDDGIKNINEYFLSATVATLLNPTFSFYQDYRTFDHQYYELSISHSFVLDELKDNFSINPYLAVGFASHSEKLYADDGLVQATLGTSFDLLVGDLLVAPSLHYTKEFDDVTENEFWLGLRLGYTFK